MLVSDEPHAVLDEFDDKPLSLGSHAGTNPDSVDGARNDEAFCTKGCSLLDHLTFDADL